MKIKGRLLLLAFLIPVGGFTLVRINTSASAQSIEISPEDYADGTKRFQAAAKKVTTGLKERFENQGIKWGSPIFLRAFKKERQLELWTKDKGKFTLFDTYHIAGTSGGPGPKLREGDGQIPEGFYFVTPDQMNPQSDFHLSFNIGYPNRFDKAHARTGSFIMIHGSDVSIGCLAMTNSKIEEIYTLADSAFKGGQKFFRVHLFPFRMSDENLASHRDHRWLPFWENLQTGYQWFEEKKLPPNVIVKDATYHFE